VPTRTNPFAVAALVTSILVLVPVALGLVVAAVVGLRRKDQRGWGLVYAAVSVCLGWTLLAALFFAIGFAGGWDYHAHGTLAEVASTEVGTCLDEDPPAVTDCSQAHDFEVFFAPRLPDPVWPGTADLADEADTLCYEAFDGYVGGSYDYSDYDYTFYAPSKSEWLSGKHTVVCVLTGEDELVGSAKGSGD
jgi:hypothetical protein